MDRYLVDTNVISAAAPARGAPNAGLIDWMDRASDRLFLSAITIAEIEQGIAELRRQNARRKASVLEAWLAALLHLYADRVLALDAACAQTLGRLSDRAQAAGKGPGLADLIIAATAQHHGLTVLTRNRKHFAPLNVRACDPFLALPD